MAKTKIFTWTCGEQFRAYLLKDGRVKIATLGQDDGWGGIDPGFSLTASVSTLKKLVKIKEISTFGPLSGHTECGCEGWSTSEVYRTLLNNRLGEFITEDNEEFQDQKRIIRSVLRHLGV